jgi:UMF1 family MFS transporter
MKLNTAQKSWILYDMGNASYALIVRTAFAAILFKYCADDVWGKENTTAYWGYVCSIAGIAAGAVSIGLGYYADKFRLKKLLLFLFVLVGTGTTAALALMQKGMAWSVLLLSFISLGCYMSANSFYDSLLLSVAQKSLRDRLSSVAYAFGYVGGVIPFIGCLVLSFCMKDKIAAMHLSFITAALWWLLLTLPLLKTVRERKNTKNDPSLDFIANFKELLKNKNVLLFLVAYFLYIDGVGTIYTMAAPIATDIGITTPQLMGVILGLQFLAFPCTLLYGRLSKSYHPRNLIFFAIGIYILISLLALLLAIPFFKDWRLHIFILLAVLIGTSQGGIQSLSRSLFSRIVPSRKAAEFFGFYNLFGKFTTIAGPVLIGIATALWGKPELGIAFLALPFLAGAILLTKVDFTPVN